MKEITVKDVVVELQKRFLGEFTVYLYSMPNEEKDYIDAILLTKKVADVDGEMHTKGVVISPNLNNPQIAASDGRLVQRLVQPMLDEILLVSSFSSCIFSNFVKHNASALFHTLPTIVSYFLMKNKPLRQLLNINLMAKNYLKSYD